MQEKGTTYNLVAEKAVLGSMIASKKICNDALGLLNENSFYDRKANAVIFKAIQNLTQQEVAIDNASLVTELQNNMKLLDQVGGVQYLAELQEYYVGDKNASYALQTVHDLSLIRQLFDSAKKLEKEYFEKEINDIPSFIDKYGKEIDEITDKRASGEFKVTSDVVRNLSNSMRSRRGSGRKSYVTGIDTGYEILNRLTGGWQNGNLIIFAARPSVGKTAFAINLMYNAAEKAKTSVAFFSLEMSAEDICTRLLASTASVNSTKLKTSDLTDSDWMAIQEAEDKISKTKIYIDDTSGIKINEIKSKLINLKNRDNNLGLVVVDYLGLINVNNPKQDHRQNIDEISRSLKGIARDLNVPIICLSQLSRANEKDNRKPRLSDLRDSGAIEQDADMVMFLYREDYQKHAKKGEQAQQAPQQAEQNDGSPFGKTSMTDVILAKNRNGEVGEFQLAFLMNIGKFVAFSNRGNE